VHDGQIRLVPVRAIHGIRGSLKGIGTLIDRDADRI
jgi:hypothetical protein